MLPSRRRSRGSASVMATPVAPGPPDAADAMDVAVGRRRYVEVDDVGQRVDVESPGGDVGGDQQLGGAVAQPAHHAVALGLVHAAVQRFGAVAAAVHRLGQHVDLGACAAEHERRLRRLDVEDPPERGRLVGALDDVGPLCDQRRAIGTGGAADGDTHRIVEESLGDRRDARRHRRREQHRLTLRGQGAEDRLDVLGEAHVEHLVGLVEHDRADAVDGERPRPRWSRSRPGVPTTTWTPRSRDCSWR